MIYDEWQGAPEPEAVPRLERLVAEVRGAAAGLRLSGFLVLAEDFRNEAERLESLLAVPGARTAA
jgi:hypothetical protein